MFACYYPAAVILGAISLYRPNYCAFSLPTIKRPWPFQAGEGCSRILEWWLGA